MGISKTKQMKWPERPAKAQISLEIRSVWSESPLYVSGPQLSSSGCADQCFPPEGGGEAGLPQGIRQFWKIGVKSFKLGSENEGANWSVLDMFKCSMCFGTILGEKSLIVYWLPVAVSTLVRKWQIWSCLSNLLKMFFFFFFFKQQSYGKISS